MSGSEQMVGKAGSGGGIYTRVSGPRARKSTNTPAATRRGHQHGYTCVGGMLYGRPPPRNVRSPGHPSQLCAFSVRGGRRERARFLDNPRIVTPTPHTPNPLMTMAPLRRPGVADSNAYATPTPRCGGVEGERRGRRDSGCTREGDRRTHYLHTTAPRTLAARMSASELAPAAIMTRRCTSSGNPQHRCLCPKLRRPRRARLRAEIGGRESPFS